jgi:hypothetical protein
LFQFNQLKDSNTITIAEACQLYKELTGYKLYDEYLEVLIYKFKHLGVFRFNDYFIRTPGSLWTDESQGDYIFEGVNKKAFIYFVNTRKSLTGSGKPSRVFQLYSSTEGYSTGGNNQWNY